MGRAARAWAMVAALALVTVGGCSTDEAAASRTSGTTSVDTRAPATAPPDPTTTATGEDTSTTTTAANEEAAGLPDGRDVVVTSITDGDTFRAGDERVRLIGIDTPEVSGGVECYGREASAALAELIPVGTRVRLVMDVEPEDRYDRTLAYVHRIADGEHVNLTMAAEGYAQPLTIPPNVAHASDFVAAARRARESGRGLWSACGGDAATLDPPPTTATGGDCEPAYPDVCIPPSPPDLDCSDITHRRFRVLPPDPHRFDGGGDGIGCER